MTGTPHTAAFLVIALALSACRQGPELAELPADACQQEHVAITTIQGDDYDSPMVGDAVSVRGIITALVADGAYIEAETERQSDQHSRAIYLSSPAIDELVSPGDRAVFTGTVNELGQQRDSLTSLVNIQGYRVCDSYQPLPVTRADLPLNSRQLESLEGMNLEISQELVVTDPRLAGQGLLTLSLGDLLPMPTEVRRPGREARAQQAKNREARLHISLHKDEEQLLPAGTRVLSIAGVLQHDGHGPRLAASEPLRIIPLQINRVAPPQQGDIRVLGLNLHNYFNGDGRGGGFPTARGAKTPAQFARQRARLAATIEHLQPHLVAVMELENDGFGPDSAAVDFIDDLQSAGGHTWRGIMPAEGGVGSDVITVGLFYRHDKLSPDGLASMLTGPEFDRLSRVPVAQSFTDLGTGQSFVVAVNHLKSKGSCPDSGPDSDLRDGQACWNAARTRAARVMARWVRQLADEQAGGHALILGDLNAYRMEDPITALLDAGFKDLNASDGLKTEFSLIWSGQAGTLDYAFASPELRVFVQRAEVLNFNSPWDRSQDLPLPWLGASDHDPVLVDLRFRSAQ